MKQLIFLGGTMGVGKTATARELQKLLAPCVFLDGDWCWDMNPFQVTQETKAMVQDNITCLLRNFLHCPAYDYVIFCWVMHQQAILDDLLGALAGETFALHNYSLVCSPQALTRRLQGDVAAGVRTADVIERSLPRLALYDALNTQKLDVSTLSAAQAAREIARQVTTK
ncbi:MAG: AAA family ATPase [Eubacteriales bacterium]|nr:AAA family ATPase [Eubacteriales bacterium]